MGCFTRFVSHLVLVASSLIPLSANAAYWYSTFADNTYGYGSSFQEAAANWCSRINGTCNSLYLWSDSGSSQSWRVDRTGGGFSRSTILVNRNNTSNCANVAGGTLPYIWQEDNTCHSTPEVICPSGQTKVNGQCENICQPGNEVVNKMLYSPGNFPSNTWTDPVGCSHQYTNIDQSSCKITSDLQSLLCDVTYTSDGNFNDPATYDYNQQKEQPEPLPEVQELPVPQTTETYEKTEPVVETNNGETTTTYTETTTQTTNAGTTIEQIGGTTVVKDSTGTIIEIIKQNTFNMYSSGNAQEVVETTENYTPSTDRVTEYNIPQQTATPTVKQSGKTGSVTTTKVTNYNAQGQVTGSTTTTTGTATDASSGNGNGDGEGGGSFCEYADVVCDFIDWFKGEDYEAPEHGETPIEEIDVGTLQSNWNSGLGSGSCPAGTVVAMPHGKSYTMDYTNACSAATSIFKPILLFFAALAAAYIIAGLRRN